MATIAEVRKHCLDLEEKRIKEFRKILSEYFKEHFIEQHRDWPEQVDIHGILIFSDTKHGSRSDFFQNNMGEKLVYKVLKDLGFVVLEKSISLLVPDYEEGQELTFAQEWRKKVKDSYENYIADLAKRGKSIECAKAIYSRFLSELVKVPEKDIINYDDYTLFLGFKFEYKFPSSEVWKEFCRLMLEDGIEKLCNNYGDIGIEVKNSPVGC